MSTTLRPQCDSCGLRSDEVPEGILLEPKTLRVLCLRCYEPDKEKRDELGRAVIREAIARFREEHGGRLASAEELIDWLNGNVDGARRLHLIGPRDVEG